MTTPRIIQALDKPVVKKRKIKRNSDPTYHPNKKLRSGSFNHGDGLLRIRCDTSTHNENGDPIRTTAMLNLSKIGINGETPSPRKLNAEFTREMKLGKSASFGSIVEIVERNEYGSPVKVKILSPTKGSTNVYMGFPDNSEDTSIRTYINKNPDNEFNKVVESVSADHPLLTSKAYQQIKTNVLSHKEQTVFLQGKPKQNSRRSLFKSVPSQKSVMHGTAKDSSLGLLKNAELTHGIGKQFQQCVLLPQYNLQTEKNIVAASSESNSQMLLVENPFMEVINENPDEIFELHTKVDMVEIKDSSQVTTGYTQLGRTTLYDISTSNVDIAFRFNMQSEQKPHFDSQFAMRAGLRAPFNLSKQQLREDNKENQSIANTDSIPVVSHCYQSIRNKK